MPLAIRLAPIIKQDALFVLQLHCQGIFLDLQLSRHHLVLIRLIRKENFESHLRSLPWLTSQRLFQYDFETGSESKAFYESEHAVVKEELG